MLRTNSKKARTNLQNYIITHIIPEVNETLNFAKTWTAADHADPDNKSILREAEVIKSRYDNLDTPGTGEPDAILFDAVCTYIVAVYAAENDTPDNHADGNRLYFFEYNFKEWTQGMPCGELFDYNGLIADPIKDLGDILEETDAERGKFTRTKAADLLTHLIYREICGRSAYNCTVYTNEFYYRK